MKKIYIGMIAALAALYSCEPLVDGKSWSGDTVSADVLEKGIVIEQFDMDEEGNYVKSDDGNYIKFSTNPSKVVEVFTKDADGAEASLSKGTANGMIELRPGRGQSPNVTLYFRTYEFDGSSVEASKDIAVKVAQELAPGMGYLVSYAGEKTWKWDVDGEHAVWGNFGYTPGDGESFADAYNGVWWGVTFNGQTFDDQQAHRGGDSTTGDDKEDSYMKFYENGNVKCFDSSGKEIRSAKFKLTLYDAVKKINDQPWSIGNLHVNGGGGVMWPYAINTGGKQPEDYEIVRLTNEQLILTYAAEGTGSWSEATFWRFRSTTDHAGKLAGYDNTGLDWTWDTEAPDGAFWGNAGYQAAEAGANWANATEGKWWGVTSTGDFAGQQAHRGGDSVTGDDDTNAWMTICPDGSLKSFNAAGAEIRSGKWSITEAMVNGKKQNVLNTTEGSILWPYAINTGGKQPTQFEIMYLSGEKLALIYAADGTGAWSEATFWRFKKK